MRPALVLAAAALVLALLAPAPALLAACGIAALGVRGGEGMVALRAAVAHRDRRCAEAPQGGRA